MGGSFNGGNSDDRGAFSEINITPFVDVMLVLLVIFMVATPLMENGIPIELPKASTQALPKKDEKPITLNLTKESRIFVDKDEVYLTSLQPALKKVFAKRQSKEIYIRADGALPYAFVAQTMAAVKLAGIHKIGLVTLPPETEAGTSK
jgi:biopolymer transport protein TolR